MWWIDGRVEMDPHHAVDLRDRGLLLGEGLFETIAVLNRVPFRLRQHLDRMQAGARVLGIAFHRQQAERAVLELVAAYDRPDGALRLTLTGGPAGRGLAPPERPQPGLFASMAPWVPPRRAAEVRLVVADIPRNERSPSSRLKTLGYLDAVMAHRSALALGADDALFLNTKEKPVCGATGNLFCLRGQDLVTPPLTDGVLPGIVRGWLLDMAAAMGLNPLERSLTAQELLAAEAVFLTNSLRLVQRVVSIGGRNLVTSSVVPDEVVARLWWQMERDCAA